MKLLPPLISSALAVSHCTTDDAIITVDCLENFSVKLTVNYDCMNQFYPDIDPTDFIISPAGTAEDTADNTCYPSTDSNDPAARYFYSDAEMTQTIAVNSPDLYFDTKCGLTPTIEEIDGEEALIFKTYICTKIPEDVAQTGMIFTRQMNDLEVKCIYSNTLPDFKLEIGKLALDSSLAVNVDGDSVDIIENPQVDPIEISSAEVVYTTNPDVTTETIALGQEMVVEFTKIGDFDFFHIDNCMADNKLATDDTNYAKVQMVESGCLVDKTAEPLKTIDPKLSADGKTFTFNQFGFVIKDTDPVELNFSMLCTLKFGTAPTDCTGTTRRQINPRQFGTQNQDSASVNFDYAVTPGDGELEVNDGIAVARDEAQDNPQAEIAQQISQDAGDGSKNAVRELEISLVLAAVVNVVQYL